MGANLWKHAPSIDAMSTTELTLYLTAAKEGPRYHLSPDKLERRISFRSRWTLPIARRS